MDGKFSSDGFDVFGRDDSLLKLLAHAMKFNYEYVDVDASGGNSIENSTISGGLEMLQKRVCNFFISLFVFKFRIGK